MSYPTVTVLGNTNNKSYLRLYSDEEVAQISDISRVVLELNTTEEIDSKVNAGIFQWIGLPKGVLGLRLGRYWWHTQIYYAKLIVFDEAYDEGIFWGTLRIRAMENTVGREFS